jgi:uncharacterized protein (DUF433 family)
MHLRHESHGWHDRVTNRRGIEDVLADFPYLKRKDILQVLRYAAWRAEEREVILASG